MKNNVDSRVRAFIQEVEKFAARWHQLKPGDDALDGDKKKCEAAVQVIKDKRQEFAELEKTRETLVYVNSVYCFYKEKNIGSLHNKLCSLCVND